MSRRWPALLFVIAALAAGCLAPGAELSPGPTSLGPSGSGSANPTGAVAERPEAVPGCPNYVTEVETGPQPTDVDENGPLAREQQRLQGDITSAVAYAEQHPLDFGSIRFENAPRVRIVLAFTGNLAEHCAALRALLEFPDEFELIWAARTEAQLLAVMDEVTRLAAEAKVFRSAALTSDRIEVHLRADSEAYAETLLAEYGELLRISVGLFPYPDRAVPPGFSCRDYGALEPVATGTPFDAAATIAQREVRSGTDFSGSVRVTNTSDSPVAFESGQPAAAVVVRPGTEEVVGVYDGAIGGTGISGTLEPGGFIDIDLLGGTASCDPALGYALPPGEYDVIVPVDQYAWPVPDAGVVISSLLSEPVPLTIVP